MPIARIGGLDIYYEIGGAGPRLLYLSGTSAGGAGGSSFPLHTLSDLGTEEMARHGISRNDVRRDDAWRRDNPEDFAKMLKDAIAAIEFRSGEPGREIGQRRQLEARRHHDTHDRLGGLAMPVLVCGGRHDGQAEPRVVENLAARIAGARLEFFDGGHMFPHQDAKAFAAISDFLL